MGSRRELCARQASERRIDTLVCRSRKGLCQKIICGNFHFEGGKLLKQILLPPARTRDSCDLFALPSPPLFDGYVRYKEEKDCVARSSMSTPIFIRKASPHCIHGVSTICVCICSGHM